jgi:hypothetical protein
MNDRSYLAQRNEGQDKSMRAADVERERITQGKGDRAQVERTADRIRDELLLTLEELERRKDRALNVRLQAASHLELILGAAIAAVVLTGAGVGVAWWRSRHRDTLLAKQRLKAVRRAWAHPNRVASSSSEQPLAVELGRKLILIFGTALATNIAKNSVQTLVPRRSATVK